MTDQEIIERFWARDESALTQSAAQYGSYCRSIAFGILGDMRDVEECVNDTRMKAWQSIPPTARRSFPCFLEKS